MKKIAFIMHNLQGGGAEKVLSDILNHINYKKYQVTLILFERKGVYLDTIPKDIEVVCIHDRLKIIPSKLLIKLMKYFPKSFYKFFIKDKYDVEIAFMEGAATQLVANSNNTKSKKIAWVHSDLLEFHWTKPLFKLGEESKCYDKLDNIIFVCNGAKESFEKVFSNNITNKQVINNPIISEEIIKNANEEIIDFNEFTIISVGRLIPVKGYDDLIRVHADLVKKYPHKLLILGEGDERINLENLISQLGVENSVELKGFSKNPHKYINSSDIFVSSSKSEGFSLVIGEAIILEKPIVSTNTVGAREILNNGKYGLLCGTTKEELKDALEKILKDRNLMDEYREKSIIRKKDFDYRNTIKMIETLIDSN